MEKKIVVFRNLLIVTIAILFAIEFVCSNKVYASSITDKSEKLKISFTASPETSTDRTFKIIATISSDGSLDYKKTTISVSAKLNYDENLFDTPTFETQKGWGGIYYEGTNKLEFDATGFTENAEIFELSFVAKSTTSEKNTDIKLDNIDFGVENVNKPIDSFTIANVNVGTNKVNISTTGNAATTQENTTNTTDTNTTEKQENTTEDQNTTQENTTEQENTIVEKENTIADQNTTNETAATTENTTNSTNTAVSEYISPVSKDATTSNKPIPQTGEKATIITAIALAIVIGIFTFIRYKKFYD